MPEFDPDVIGPSGRYRLLAGAISPRPIAVVSSLSPGGVVNVAPFSFFNGAGATPMALMFVVQNPSDGSDKDTLRNVRPRDEGGTGEFVVHLATEANIREVAALSESLPYEVSELDHVPLTTAPSTRVAPPRLASAPIAYECVTAQVVTLAPGGPLAGNIVIGRVVYVHVRDDVIDEDLRFDLDRLATVGRMGGPDYATTRDRFRVPRGLAALDVPDPFEE